jgi:hypothetical protein
MRSVSGILTIVFLSVLAAVSIAPGEGNGKEFSEYEVKAAFIFNIAKFVEWPDRSPAERGETLNLCVLGSDPFEGALDQIAGKQVKGKRLHIRHVASTRNVRGCNMLFISSSEKEKLPNIMEALRNTSALTIGDTAGYGRRGVMINFYLEENRIRFEMNPDKAKQAGLVISAQLLKLARIIRTE